MPRLSPGQASYILERLVADRRVSARDVSRYVTEMQREISDLENRLQTLRQATGGSSRAAARGGRSAEESSGARRARRRSRITPEQAASRKLQGRYLGLIRQVPASRRAPFQKIAREKGREAAIKELVSALGK